MKFFEVDGPVYNVFSRVCDIVMLNFLWLVCSLPIVTMGAATTALYYCMLQISRDTDASLAKKFFKAYKRNFKQGCILTIIFAISGISTVAFILICNATNTAVNIWIVLQSIILIFVWEIIVSYSFPLMAQFDNTIFNTLKNALYMSLSNMKRTIAILGIDGILVFLCVLFPQGIIFGIRIMLLFGVALLAFLKTQILVGVFDKYIDGLE